MLGETFKRLRKDARIEGQFTNQSLDVQRQQPEDCRKEVPYKFVMKRTGHTDVRSSQKYQPSDISTKIEISKKFEGREARSLPVDPSDPLSQQHVTPGRIANGFTVQVEEKLRECYGKLNTGQLLRKFEKLLKGSTKLTLYIYYPCPPVNHMLIQRYHIEKVALRESHVNATH